MSGNVLTRCSAQVTILCLQLLASNTDFFWLVCSVPI